jgi:hypothetical protein
MTNNLDLLDTIKYRDEEEIKSFVEWMACNFKDRRDELVRVVQEDSLFTFKGADDDRIVKAIFLSLVLTTITSNLYNPILRQELIEKFKKVSTGFDIPYSDVVRLTEYEERLRQLIT